jgi:hypothetical protein
VSSVLVPSLLTLPASADCRTGRPASSLRVGHAAAAGVTHVGGHMLGGMRVLQAASSGTIAASGTYRWKIPRHPNALGLYMECRVRGISQAAQLVATAGTGTPVSGTVVGAGDCVVLLPLWDEGDKGWCDLTLYCDACTVEMIAAFDFPRTALEDDEHAVLIRDLTHPRIGLREEDAIAQATHGSVRGILVALAHAWDDGMRQAVAWSGLHPCGVETTSDEFVEVFDSTWRHQARLRTAEKVRVYHVGAVAWVTGGATYELKFSSDNPEGGADSTVLDGKTNDTAAWQVSTLDIDTNVAATLTFEARISEGAGTVYITSISIAEKEPQIILID